MGWLTDLTDWWLAQIQALWDAVSGFVADVGIYVFEVVTDISTAIINAIPVPEFFTTYNLSALLSATGSPWLGWAFETFQLSACFTVLALGVGFNLLRKLLTLGQW